MLIKNEYIHAYTNFIHDSHKLEATWRVFNGWMVKLRYTPALESYSGLLNMLLIHATRMLDVTTLEVFLDNLEKILLTENANPERSQTAWFRLYNIFEMMKL